MLNRWVLSRNWKTAILSDLSVQITASRISDKSETCMYLDEKSQRDNNCITLGCKFI